MNKREFHYKQYCNLTIEQGYKPIPYATWDMNTKGNGVDLSNPLPVVDNLDVVTTNESILGITKHHDSSFIDNLIIPQENGEISFTDIHNMD